MFEQLLKFLEEILSLGTYRDQFVALCLNHPVWAALLLIIVLNVVLYLLVTKVPGILGRLRSLIGDRGIFMGVALASGLAVIAVFLVRGAMERVPTWADVSEVYVGDPITLSWTFNGGSELAFEVEHARDVRFRADAKSFVTDVYQRADSQSYSRSIDNIHDDARFFRLRAVDPLDHTHRLSAWSDIRRIAQYDSSYRRITETGTVTIGISKIDHDDLFKWASGEADGVDIRLVKAVVAELSERTKRSLQVKFHPMGWTELLDAPAGGRVDMIVAAISRGAARERKYGISFSAPYFCTSQALIYRSDEYARSMREMIAGKRVGFEKSSTSENLVLALSKDATVQRRKPPGPIAYGRPADVSRAVARREIDVGITDLPFAAEAVMITNSLHYRPFLKSDIPTSLPKENQVDEYAIGMRGADVLVPIVNDILNKLKSVGALKSMLQTTANDYERFKGFSHDSLASAVLQPSALECR